MLASISANMDFIHQPAYSRWMEYEYDLILMSYFPVIVIVVGNLLLFYLLFYSSLAALFAICLVVHHATLPDVLGKRPKFTNIHTMGEAVQLCNSN